MREIKFRGLEKESNKWVFGYVRHWKCCFGDEWHIQGENDNVHIVISETIGQFTGLKDAVGREIYEADIIQSEIAEYLAVVEFRKGAFVAVTGPVESYQALSGVLRLKGLRVIGNVHDNPELLERKP